MDGPDVIALAIPVFFLLIGVEVWVARRRKRPVYHFADAITDLGCGVADQVVGFFIAAALLGGYIFVYDHFRLVTFAQSSPVPWILAFVGVDLAYYWWHRLSHHINFMWAIHVVHHSSEDFNLAVALRQEIFADVTLTPFYLALALAGVSPVVLVLVRSLTTLYQFWIHTELVPKLGPLDRWVNTPSAHRVHHAVNRVYMDKNFAKVLMIWDRLFGSYEPEVEPCVYGLSSPVRSFNPVWVWFHHWVYLVQVARRAPSIFTGLQVFFRSPAWHPPWEPEKPKGGAPVTPETFVKFTVPSSPKLNGYVAAQFVFPVAATFVLLMLGGSLAWVASLALASLVVMALVAWGGLFESRPWAVALERARLTLTALGVIAWLWQAAQPLYWALPIALAAVGSMLWLGRAQARALRPEPAV